jgi:hypothetical protein
MRQLALSLALVLAPAAALAATMDVPLDHSAFVTLPAPAHNIVIGNPAIADASVVDQRHIIVTGKGAGVTNLVITDASGRPIFDREIIVGGVSGGRVALIAGGQGVTTYNCAPVCEQIGGVSGAPAAAAAPAGPSGAAVEAPHPGGSIAASPNTP